ncbi:hypothetical protein EV182_002746 [Spiromyces aspiralis]|uniref:Uncharacterized protein n=1 Tax=Spiromyces aspiralis TaxID=68401 RepID=A0ACC1HUT9_9FUNG|nr:hypothetical protein EV182_002746 [Spiromyces aspiralis]
MRSFSAAIATIVGAGIAFNAVVSAEDCQALNIVKACVETRNNLRSQMCPDNQDYSCLCQWYGSLEGCYDNCPNDQSLAADKNGATNQRTIYCNLASQYDSTSASSSTSGESTSATSSSGTNTGASSNGSHSSQNKSGSSKDDNDRDTEESSSAAPSLSAGGLMGIAAAAVAIAATF